jgi:VWFA-related protein
MARLGDDVSLSLDFVDGDHVLLTFNQRKLLQRHSECPSSHDDRLVRAVVLEVPSGRVVKSADWYLHDHRRYLWFLGSGKFLLRKLNSLYLVDSALHEKLLMNSPKDLLWVTVTPDKKQIIVETAEDSGSAKEAQAESPQARKVATSQFVVEFLDAETLAPQRTIKLGAMVSLEGTSTGYADYVRKGDLWLIRFGSTPTERRNIARVRSQTVPRVFYSSNNSILIGRCPAAACDYSVTAFTLTGNRLWRQHWSQPRYFPAVTRSEDNGRFGVSSLRHAVLSSAPANYDGAENNDAGVAEDGVEQDVQVFETASGDPVLSVGVSPAMMNGQNVSLSADGRRLAVVQDSTLEIYPLPQMSNEEKAKFTALKADVPGLYVLSSKSEVESLTEPDATTESDQPETAEFIRNDSPQPAAGPQGPPAGDERGAGDVGSQPSHPEDKNLPSGSPVQAAAATSPAEGSEPVTTIKVKTRAVVVDVVVTDAKGHPIRGLRKQDFQVTEDAKPQDVRSFRESSDADGARVPGAQTGSAAKPVSNVFNNQTQAPESGAVTMVLLDLLNTPAADQQYARQELIKVLKAKTGKSQFALCALSSDQAAYLRLIQGFTPDENVLLAAVTGKKGMPHLARWQAAATGASNAVNTVGELAKGGATSGWQGLLHGLEQLQAQGQATDTDARVGITTDALIQLARYLSGIPGRKNLVWLSGSFPISFSPGAADTASSGNRSYMNKVKQATNLLAEAQVAVYPVDVRSALSTGIISAADNIGIAPSGGPTPSGPGQLAISGGASDSPNDNFQQRMMQELALQAAERNTMNQFAIDTGGMAFFNSNAIQDAIVTATEQGSNHYTLSYSPANTDYRGKYRRIRVTVAEKGYHLHYRQGYFAEDFSVPVNDRDALRDVARDVGIAAMQHGSPQSHEIRLAVRVVPMGGKHKVDRAKAGQILLASSKNPTLPVSVEIQHYGIDYAVNSSDLRFLPLENETHHAMLSLMTATFGDDGTQLSGVSTLWTSDLNPALYQDVISGGVRLHQEVDVSVGAVFLRLGVIDKVSNHVGTIELPLPIPAPPDVPRTVKHSLPEIEPD